MTVVKSFSGDAFVLYSMRKGTDIAFQLPGKDISFPSGTSGPKMFTIDGITFETLFIVNDKLAKTTGMSDIDVLKKHRESEVEYIKGTASPLTKFVEMGPRERPAGNGQPAFTFYLWQMADPAKPSGPSQYFLSTVSDGEVVVLSAIVPDASGSEAAMLAFQSYASSFQHILRKEQCPQTGK